MGVRSLKACLELPLGAALIPVREPHNPHDANAVLLLSLYGAQVGYVQREVAGIVAGAMDAGETVFAKVVRVANLRNGRMKMRLRYPRAVLWSEPPREEPVDGRENMTPGAWFEEEDAVDMEKRRLLEKIK